MPASPPFDLLLRRELVLAFGQRPATVRERSDCGTVLDLDVRLIDGTIVPVYGVQKWELGVQRYGHWEVEGDQG